MVDAESASNHSLAVFPRRPGEGHAGIDIPVVLLAEARAHAAESLRPAGSEIERVGQPARLVEEIEDGVPYAQVERELGPHPVLVLGVAVVIILTQVVDRQRARESGFGHHVRRQILHRGECNFSVFARTLI